MAEKSTQDILKNLGINEETFRSDLDVYTRRIDPFASTGLDENYFAEAKEFDQSFLADLGTGLFNSLVMDTGEGIGNLLPTMYFASPGTKMAEDAYKAAGMENVLFIPIFAAPKPPITIPPTKPIPSPIPLAT